MEETNGESFSKHLRLESNVLTKDKVKSRNLLNKKKNLGGLVRLNSTISHNKPSSSYQPQCGSNLVKIDRIAEVRKVGEISRNSTDRKAVTQETLSGLALLGAYSGSESD